MKCNNIRIIGTPGGEEKEQGIEDLLKKIMTENFPNFQKGKAIQVQEAQRVQIKMNTKRITPRHIIIKMPILKIRENLKSSKGEIDSNMQGSSYKASSFIYIRQNRFKNKGHKKRQRRSFYNLKGKDPSGNYKHCKYICTQHRGTQIHKENLGGLQERYRQQYTYSRA